MKLTVAASWVEAPLKAFVDDGRVRLAILLHSSGQVLGQFGFARSVDVMTACALAAATAASSAELGRLIDGRPFNAMHFVGVTQQIFLAPVPIEGGKLVLLAVFDEVSSLGLVQLFFQEFCATVKAIAPAANVGEPALDADFEFELNRNLAVMFGRA